MSDAVITALLRCCSDGTAVAVAETALRAHLRDLGYAAAAADVVAANTCAIFAHVRDPSTHHAPTQWFSALPHVDKHASSQAQRAVIALAVSHADNDPLLLAEDAAERERLEEKRATARTTLMTTLANARVACECARHYDAASARVADWLHLDGDDDGDALTSHALVRDAFATAVRVSGGRDEKSLTRETLRCAIHAQNILTQSTLRDAMTTPRNLNKTRDALTQQVHAVELAMLQQDDDGTTTTMRDPIARALVTTAPLFERVRRFFSRGSSLARRLEELERQIRERRTFIVRSLLNAVAQPTTDVSDVRAHARWLLYLYALYYGTTATDAELYRLRRGSALTKLDRYLNDVTDLIGTITNETARNDGALSGERATLEELRTHLTRVREVHREFSSATLSKQRVGELEKDLADLKGAADKWLKELESRGVSQATVATVAPLATAAAAVATTTTTVVDTSNSLWEDFRTDDVSMWPTFGDNGAAARHPSRDQSRSATIKPDDDVSLGEVLAMVKDKTPPAETPHDGMRSYFMNEGAVRNV